MPCVPSRTDPECACSPGEKLPVLVQGGNMRVCPLPEQPTQIPIAASYRDGTDVRTQVVGVVLAVIDRWFGVKVNVSARTCDDQGSPPVKLHDTRCPAGVHHKIAGCLVHHYGVARGQRLYKCVCES